MQKQYSDDYEEFTLGRPDKGASNIVQTPEKNTLLMSVTDMLPPEEPIEETHCSEPSEVAPMPSQNTDQTCSLRASETASSLQASYRQKLLRRMRESDVQTQMKIDDLSSIECPEQLLQSIGCDELEFE